VRSSRCTARRPSTRTRWPAARLDEVNDVFDFLNSYPGKPLLANAYQERYMPGSSFKVITTGIALENGVTSLDRSWPSETEWVPPQTTDPIQNYGGSSCGGTMTEVFFRSCNIPFAQMAVELGPERMVAGTQAWGIGERIPIDLPGAVASSFGDGRGLRRPAAAARDRWLRPGQRPDGAAAHGDGRRHRRQRREDDGAVRRRRHARPRRDGARPDRSRGVEDARSRPPPRPRSTPDGRCGQQRHRPQMQLDGGIQAAAKTGTAQLNFVGRTAAVARVDHRLRARPRHRATRSPSC
jgi:cell division protein FtsI/penicillin-binding protein 2